MRSIDPPAKPGRDGYERRRQHVIWYGTVVLLALVAVIVLQLVT